jgi:E3 ubiquitin-protein ligase MARCH6
MEDAASDAGPAAQQHQESTLHDDRPNAAAIDTAPSICRICRGEGTPAEPLFYPCKCSGSIKYVHQDCLMEWLSHSQKKYCELCKTPFRFTKLYAPDMPQSLPIHIFIEHMAKYLLRNLLVWLRAAVAISVWVFWLPYFMRAVWSFMFWISDEGLGASSIMSRMNETNNTMSTIPSSILAIGTCPASPLFAATTTSAAEVEAVVGQLEGKDVSDYFVRFLLNSFTSPLLASDGELGNVLNASAAPSNASQSATGSSLLGDVAILGNLTRNSSLNRAIVSVLEGQIITVLVIISFILIILVRDYVVQQQPEINMRAAFAAPENDMPVPEPDEVIQPENLPPTNLAPTDSDDETLEDSDQVGDQDWQRMPPGRLAAAGEQPLTPDSSNHSMLDHDSFPTSSTNTSLQNDQLNSQAREGADEGDAAEEPATLDDYLRIYRRANGDLQDTLRIIEEEGLQEKLKYWVEFTRRSTSTIENTSHAIRSEPITEEEEQEQEQERPEHDIDSDHDTLQSPSNWKGKEPWSPTLADLDISGPSDAHDDDLFGAPASRPRSMSDGFQEQLSVNPLANNSWSFDALPVDDKPDALSQALPAIQEQSGQDLTDGEPSSQSRDLDDEDDSHLRREHYRRLPDREIYQHHPPREILHRHPDLNEREHPLDAEVEVQPPHANGAAEEAAVNGGDAPAAGLAEKVADFMWGNMDDLDPPAIPRALIVAAHRAALDDMAAQEAVERAVERGAAAGNNDGEDLWVDVPAEPNGDDGEGIAADDNAAAMDPEAIEDLEDFEGVMELIGMRGPIAGLFQNAIFCAVLVSVTIFACIFIPYNIGRVSVWLLASPMRIVRLLFELSKLLQDATFLVGGLGSWCALNIVDMFATVMSSSVKAHIVSARKMSWGLWTGAAGRICTFLFKDFFPMSATEIHNFSAVSHDALNIVKGNVLSVFSNISGSLTMANAVGFDKILATTTTVLSSTSETAIKLSSILTKPSSWVIDLSMAEEWPSLDPELTYWSSLDRFWAILAGYATMFLIGALYLKKGSPFSRNAIMHAWEAGVIDSLQQASGIMKVILIISIEMLVFPLYCGLLLDAALLPLFEDTTLTSRIVFTCKYPMTSVFVHWFVGTGYMFHFALFVSMCRKIMRPGVLCEFYLPPMLSFFLLLLYSITD